MTPRTGVGALFAGNGAVFATVLPRYPLIKGELDLSAAHFGLVIAGYPLGALVAGVFSGLAVTRWGSASPP